MEEQNLTEEVAISQTPNDIWEEVLLKYSDGFLKIINLLLHYSYKVLRKQSKPNYDTAASAQQGSASLFGGHSKKQRSQLR